VIKIDTIMLEELELEARTGSTEAILACIDYLLEIIKQYFPNFPN